MKMSYYYMSGRLSFNTQPICETKRNETKTVFRVLLATWNCNVYTFCVQTNDFSCI